MSKKRWCPTAIKQTVRHGIKSSTSPVVVETDDGLGYFKALGNSEGPQVLACEFVGTSLAHLLGIPTFEFCIIQHREVPEIRLRDGRLAKPGPGFITKAEDGNVWDGTEKMLKRINNAEDITRLVCVDTWTRNQDRYFPREDGTSRRRINNVFLSKEQKQSVILKAFDFTHAFTNGRDVNAKIVQNVNDDKVYGLFPEFEVFLDRETATQTCDKLNTIRARQIQLIIDQIPREWEIDSATRKAWVEFIVSRASFLSKNFFTMIGLKHISKQKKLFDLEE